MGTDERAKEKEEREKEGAVKSLMRYEVCSCPNYRGLSYRKSIKAKIPGEI